MFSECRVCKTELFALFSGFVFNRDIIKTELIIISSKNIDANELYQSGSNKHFIV